MGFGLSWSCYSWLPTAAALGSRPVSYYVATVRSPRRKVATQKSPYDLTVNIQPTLLDCSYISCLVVLILTT